MANFEEVMKQVKEGVNNPSFDISSVYLKDLRLEDIAEILLLLFQNDHDLQAMKLLESFDQKQHQRIFDAIVKKDPLLLQRYFDTLEEDDKVLLAKGLLKSLEETNPAEFGHVFNKLAYFLSNDSQHEILDEFLAKDENLQYAYDLAGKVKEVLGQDNYIAIAERMVDKCNVFEVPQVVVNDLWVAEKLDFKKLLEKLGEERYKALFHMMESWPGIKDEALRHLNK